MVLDSVGLTGSNGMLGRHLRAVLHAADIRVVAVSRSDDGGSNAWDLCNWLDMDDLDELFPDVKAVIHAGAMVKPSVEVDRARMFDANVRACLNLGLWAKSRNIPLVYVSGAVVYADPYERFQRESAARGWSNVGGFYGFSKLLGEDVLIRLREKGLKLCLLRPTSIYGFGIAADKMVPRFLSAASEGKVIELSQPVEERVDLIHATDVSDAVLAALRAECWETLNISSGEPISIRELAEACVTVAGNGRIEIQGNLPAEYEPQVKYSLDTSRAGECISWQPRIDVQTGLGLLLNCQYLTNP